LERKRKKNHKNTSKLELQRHQYFKKYLNKINIKTLKKIINSKLNKTHLSFKTRELLPTIIDNLTPLVFSAAFINSFPRVACMRWWQEGDFHPWVWKRYLWQFSIWSFFFHAIMCKTWLHKLIRSSQNMLCAACIYLSLQSCVGRQHVFCALLPFVIK
jgi:hypothetical protein